MTHKELFGKKRDHQAYYSDSGEMKGNERGEKWGVICNKGPLPDSNH